MVVGKAKVDLEILINVPNKHSSIHSLPFAKDKSRHNDDKTFKSKPLCYLSYLNSSFTFIHYVPRE